MRVPSTEGRCPVCRQRTVYAGHITLAPRAPFVVDVSGFYIPIPCGNGKHRLGEIAESLGAAAPEHPLRRVYNGAVIVPLPEAC
jgi:hypothetical protein